MLRGELAGIEDARRNIRSMNGATPKKYGNLKIVPLTNVNMRPIEWIWEGMIARGQYHVFAGDSGIGKTQLLLNIAAAISRGGYFPTMHEPTDAGKVVYLSGEDSVSQTIKPRFMACAGNPDNFIVINPDTSDGGMLILPHEAKHLTELCLDENVRLMIVDPVTSFMPSAFNNDSTPAVRGVATKLWALGEQANTAVICLTHLTKQRMGPMKNRVIGSQAWVSGARIVLGAVRMDDKLLFGKLKANITDEVGVYDFEMTTKSVDGIGDVVAVDWADKQELIDRRLSEFSETEIPNDTTSDVVYRALYDELKNHQWHRSKELVERIRRETGAGERTIKRIALEDLKVQTRREPDKGGHTSWRMPED